MGRVNLIKVSYKQWRAWFLGSYWRINFWGIEGMVLYHLHLPFRACTTILWQPRLHSARPWSVTSCHAGFFSPLPGANRRWHCLSELRWLKQLWWCGPSHEPKTRGRKKVKQREKNPTNPCSLKSEGYCWIISRDFNNFAWGGGNWQQYFWLFNLYYLMAYAWFII